MAKRTCSIDGCESPHNAKGFCLLHYMRWKRSGDPGGLDPLRVYRPAVCEIEGCGRPHKGYGLCIRHYARYKRYGDPLAPARGGPGYQAPHGTLGRYEYHGCRCAPCAVAAREARRKWRESPAARRRHAANQKAARGAFRVRIDAIKLAAGCADCGYREHPSALDFDHMRGDKLFNVSRGSARPWGDVVAEIAKCEVVCANCHRIRTVSRFEVRKAPS